MSYETDNMPFEATVQVALHILEGFNTPRSMAVFMLAREYLLDNYNPLEFATQLDALGMNINCYDQHSISQFRDDYCSTTMLSKLPPKSNDTFLSETARTSFQDGEAIASSLVTTRWTNVAAVAKEFKGILGDDPLSLLRNTFRNVLGRAPSLRRIIDTSYFSEGASLGQNSRKASAASKCVSDCYITPDLARALHTIAGDGSIFDLHPLFGSGRMWFLSPGNLVSTVPKNIKTDRTIAIEPEINQFVQRGIGDTISARLRKQGIDLTNQSYNQAGALRAMDAKLATIDLKNASNSLNAMVMMTLLPPDWWDLIAVSRSPYWTMDDRAAIACNQATWHEYHMLSSMGNGFTFELESAVFYVVCLACAVPQDQILIYGDDIIIPQQYVADVAHVLSVLGFVMNKEKSFITGAFYESCGVYAFHGVDVTPFKIKELLYGDKDRIILANKIRWFSHCSSDYCGCDRRFLPAYRLCVNRISNFARSNCRGPLDGSLLLWSNVDEVKLVYSKKRCLFKISRLSPSNDEQKKRFSDHNGLLAFRLFELERYSSDRMPLTYTMLSESLKRLCTAAQVEIDSRVMSYKKVRRGNVVKTAEVGYSVIHGWIEKASWYEPGRWR